MTKTERKREREHFQLSLQHLTQIYTEAEEKVRKTDKLKERKKFKYKKRDEVGKTERIFQPFIIKFNTMLRKERERQREKEMIRQREKERKGENTERKRHKIKRQREYFQIACSHLVQIYNHTRERKGDSKMKRKRQIYRKKM